MDCKCKIIGMVDAEGADEGRDGRKRGGLTAKERTTGGFSPLFLFDCNELKTSALINSILSKELGIDFPCAILVGSYAFDDSFLAQTRQSLVHTGFRQL